MRGHLLGPLVRRAQRVRPADGVVVVGPGPAHLVQMLLPERGGFILGTAIGSRGEHEGAVDATLGRGAVVADDEVHQGVVEYTQFFQRVDHPPGVVVGVFEEGGIHLHLMRQDRLELGWHVVPGGNALRARGEHRIGRDDAQPALAGESRFAQRIPTLIEAALVLGDPVLGHMVRRVRGAGGEVHEEGLVRGQALLQPHVVDGLVGQIGHEVVGRVQRCLDRGHAVDQGGCPLVGLPADEAVEALEATEGRPMVKRTRRPGFPHRHFVALAELGGVVAVLAQDLRQRYGRVGAGGAVAGRGRGGLGDVAHGHRMVVAAREQRRPRG
ncbi:hypothetical protein D3C87_783680 [compost metagenome]